MSVPLDMGKDPDRFDPAVPGNGSPRPGQPLDPALDPDRFPSPGRTGGSRGQTLPDLLGEGAYEQEREGFAWLFGLLGVLAFLVLFVLAVKLFGA